LINVLNVDFKDREDKWVGWFYADGNTRWTRLGSVYNSMMQRARKGGLFQEKRPSYAGVTYHPVFADFQGFSDWAVNQCGWGRGWPLDKDLLTKKCNDRMYGPETSVFLPHAINRNIAQHRGGVLMQGVYKKGGLFYAKFTRRVGDKMVGSIVSTGFKTQQEAHNLFCEFKELYVKMLADTYKSDLDPRAYEALQNWTVH
jgi:hypothetical protein